MFNRTLVESMFLCHNPNTHAIVCIQVTHSRGICKICKPWPFFELELQLFRELKL